MKHRDPSRYEFKIICEVERARTVLDELETTAQARRAYAEIVTIHAARDLSNHIEQLLPTLRRAFGFASLKITRDVEVARKQLNAWIARLLATLLESNSMAS